eukprot:NODE_8200_length_1515_cov_4.031700.p1 GENE.NODE_8200_length_1515_cov_4.031700~~NODE_8200_length_1515_cov_4.031700.p1  ORF type:complete len:441 (-),score=127.51 NODE_8200_length_1515_cov_4.031700:193-1335(-)
MMLPQRKKAKVCIPRILGVSLLANMFLCTFNQVFSVMPGRDQMPVPSFARLLSAQKPQEVAKLQMFLNFFRRMQAQPPVGNIVIDRIVGSSLSKNTWCGSPARLLPLVMAPPHVGFETRPDLAHAVFANMYIGSGVLCGGCAQEEIRFSICPELCLSMLLCPRMLHDEALQIVGAEQFSAYGGYGLSLKYGGNHNDTSSRGEDGSMLTTVLTIDALDLRHQDASLRAQLDGKSMLRELNKSLAAFMPVDDASVNRFPVVAIGNWGCGVYKGFAPLKVMLQWASASQCGRLACYFPFSRHFGPELAAMQERAVAAGITVGELMHVLWSWRCPTKLFRVMGDVYDDHRLLHDVANRLQLHVNDYVAETEVDSDAALQASQEL